jgi:hypothetical protein
MSAISLELVVLEYNLDFGGWVENWHLTKSLTNVQKFRLSENRAELSPELEGSESAETLPRIRVVHQSFLPFLNKSSEHLEIREDITYDLPIVVETQDVDQYAVTQKEIIEEF